MQALARNSCHYVRPIFREPGQCVLSVNGTLECVPGQILERLRLQPFSRIFDEVMQAFVSSSALQRFCDRRTGPSAPGEIDDAGTVSLAEPGRGIELDT